MSPIKDLSNKKFGYLTVLCQSEYRNPTKRSIYWVCKCKCGKIDKYNGYYLRTGDTKSCGCLKIEMHTKRLQKHGKYYSSSYKCWRGMKDRCLNPSALAYKRYGDRGIKVCDSWIEDFENFYNDMGEKPKGKSLERIDNNKGYCKENCIWASPKTQAQNTRRSFKNRDLPYPWKMIKYGFRRQGGKLQHEAQCSLCLRMIIFRDGKELSNFSCSNGKCPSLILPHF